MRLSILVLLLSCTVVGAQKKKTIFIVADAEGVAGVCREDQLDPRNQEMRQLFTGEINAAVDGFLAGGAQEVIVWDGHHGGQTLSTLTIHPKARLLTGTLEAIISTVRDSTAVAFVGERSSFRLSGGFNLSGGILARGSLAIGEIQLNEKTVGEIDIITALAGQSGIPAIMLSGDRDAAHELQQIVPKAEVAEVKNGFSMDACNSLSATAARNLIRKTARRSMSKLGEIKPYKVSGPVTLQVRFAPDRSFSYLKGHRDVEVLEDGTIRFHGKDFLEAWKLYRSQ